MARAGRATLAALVALAVAGCGADAGAPGSSPSTSPTTPATEPVATPRTLDLPGRVVELPARSLTLVPRVLDLRPRAERGAVALDADVLFEFGSATLSPSAAVVLAQVVPRVAAARGRRVVVTGHTDAVGTDADNLALSRRRAEAVRAFLQGRAPGVRLAAAGVGESQPVAPDAIGGADNPSGRRLNRRVTITVG